MEGLDEAQQPARAVAACPRVKPEVPTPLHDLDAPPIDFGSWTQSVAVGSFAVKVGMLPVQRFPISFQSKKM